MTRTMMLVGLQFGYQGQIRTTTISFCSQFPNNMLESKNSFRTPAKRPNPPQPFHATRAFDNDVVAVKSWHRLVTCQDGHMYVVLINRYRLPSRNIVRNAATYRTVSNCAFRRGRVSVAPAFEEKKGSETADVGSGRVEAKSIEHQSQPKSSGLDEKYLFRDGPSTSATHHRGERGQPRDHLTS